MQIKKGFFRLTLLLATVLGLSLVSFADNIVAQLVQPPIPGFPYVQMIIESTLGQILGIQVGGAVGVVVLDNGVPVEDNATLITNAIEPPGSTLFGLNLPIVTDADKIDLFFGGLQVVGETATVPAFFTQKSPTLTDPALIDLLGPATFDFSFTSSTQINGIDVSVWTMTEIVHNSPTPEPSTMLLLGSASSLIIFRRRLKFWF